MSLSLRPKVSPPATAYDSLSDIEQKFIAIFNTSQPQLATLRTISTPDQMRTAILPPESSLRQTLSTTSTRIQGLVMAGRALIAHVEKVIEESQRSVHWHFMLWGSITMFLKVLKDRRYSVEQGLELVELLVMTPDLLSLNACHAQRTQNTRVMAFQIVAEIVCTLGETIVHLWGQPPRSKVGVMNIEEPLLNQIRLASDRIKIFVKNTAGIPARSLAADGLHLPYNNITKDMLSTRFWGRDEYLPRMKDALKLGTRGRNFHLALHGLPGVGKTQLALRYAEYSTRDYDIIIWSTAVHEQKIRDTLARAAHVIGIPGAELKINIEERAQNMLSWLETTEKKWLLIFDNVDKLDVLKDFRISSDCGHVLITSRDPKSGTSPMRDGIQVTAFSYEDAKEFFFRNIDGAAGWTQSSAQVAKLLKEWDGLPMALDQMSSYIRESSMPFPAFAKSYEKHRRQVHEMHDHYAQEWGYTNTTATAFSIHHLSHEARRLLHALSFFDPDHIFDEASLYGTEEQQVLLKIFQDSFSYFGARDELVKRSLLRKDASGLAVHRLVQAVSFDDMDSDERHEMFKLLLDLLRVVYSQSVMGSSLRGIWEPCERYYSHVDYLLEMWKQVQDCSSGRSDAHLQQLVSTCTWYMFERGYFSEADRLLHNVDSLLKGDDNLTASCKFSLAGVRNECNRIAEAKVLIDEVVTIQEKTLSPDNPTLSNTYYSAGIVYMEYGDLDTAFRFHEKAWRVQQLRAHVDETQAAAINMNLSYCYARSGNTQKAVEHAEKGLELSSRLGELSDHYAEGLFNMGNVRLLQSRFADALELHAKALGVREAIMPAHDKTGYSLHKLAVLHESEGDLGKALEMLDKAISIFECNFDFAPRVARSQYRRAKVLSKLGQTSASDEARSEALRLRDTIRHFPVEREETDESYDVLICSWFR